MSSQFTSSQFLSSQFQPSRCLPLLGLSLLLAAACGGDDDPEFALGGTNADETPDGGGGSGGGSGTATSGGTSGATGGTTPTDTGTTSGGSGSTTTSGGTSGSTSSTTGPQIEGSGYRDGDTAYDVTLTTQAGIPWSLYDLYGSKVVLVVGHMYSGGDMERMMEYLGGVSGVHTAAMVGYNSDETVATQTDVATYASLYGVGTVMFDPTLTTFNEWSQNQPPRLYLIDEEMVIYWTNQGFTADGELESKIDTME